MGVSLICEFLENNVPYYKVVWLCFTSHPLYIIPSSKDTSVYCMLKTLTILLSSLTTFHITARHLCELNRTPSGLSKYSPHLSFSEIIPHFLAETTFVEAVWPSFYWISGCFYNVRNQRIFMLDTFLTIQNLYETNDWLQHVAIETQSIFSKIPTKHPQSTTIRLSYECLLWVQTLIYILSQSAQWCVKYHYNDVIMGTTASQITSLTIAYSSVYSDADQRKHQGFASLAFVRGIHRGPVNSPHKWPVIRKMFPFDDVIMSCYVGLHYNVPRLYFTCQLLMSTSEILIKDINGIIIWMQNAIWITAMMK